MKKIIDYKIVMENHETRQYDNPQKLETYVKVWIEAGWQPYGNPIKDETGMYQAMVLFEGVDELLPKFPK